MSENLLECINRVSELEELFSANQYNGAGNHAFVIEEGTIPIMVSAPHATNHFRNERVKPADMYTGGIARYLHEETGCHLIYSSKFTKSDPNFDISSQNEYQKQLREYVEKNNVLLLLDLHGAALSKEYAVEMGTAPHSKKILPEEKEEDPSLQKYKFIDDVVRFFLEQQFKKCSVKKNAVWKNVIFGGGKQNTITKYISESTGTACLQLEINRLYRMPQNQKEFCGLIEGLTEIICFFSDIDWNEPDYEIFTKMRNVQRGEG